MHDTVFAKQIQEVANNKLKELGKNTRICAINVKLSPLSHVKPETLKETFGATVEGTNLEGIVLDIKTSEIEIKCNSCRKAFFSAKMIFSCPECQSANLSVKETPECFVESIEVQNG
ncbi:MAG: hydrogenase maturation nickel metallochaperone HypA [Candidatus Omnitrophica bacterium]|jgi:hydrogenase nickel insertion protein HypA|nr:hydrogenase maturation nickel metallochaperone HypA [Candidatus Omnitrophota bacterium]